MLGAGQQRRSRSMWLAVCPRRLEGDDARPDRNPHDQQSEQAGAKARILEAAHPRLWNLQAHLGPIEPESYQPGKQQQRGQEVECAEASQRLAMAEENGRGEEHHVGDEKDTGAADKESKHDEAPARDGRCRVLGQNAGREVGELIRDHDGRSEIEQAKQPPDRLTAEPWCCGVRGSWHVSVSRYIEWNSKVSL